MFFGVDVSIVGATCPSLQLLMPVWVISGPLPSQLKLTGAFLSLSPGSQVQGFLFDEHLGGQVLSPAEYHAPPTTQQLEILEISLVVTMTERHCWHLMNGRQ